MKGYLYHIKNPQKPDINEGYIGVVKESKGVRKRFREHSLTKNRIMSHHIKENNISVDDVEILFYGDIEECYKREFELRPEQNIGWNIAKGGGGPYYSSIESLSEYRSSIQTQRMQNENLKKQQAETFKKNYYSNDESQKLRSQRAKEHMSDPIKKQKALSGIHKLHKCPYCNFESNKGNLTRHIRSKHNDN